MPAGQGRAQGAAGIAAGRLDPDVLEQAGPQQLAVGHAIQRHAAGHDQVVAAGQLAGGFRQPEHDLLGDLLDGQGHVHVVLVQLGFRFAAGQAEQLLPGAVVAHGEAGGIIEIVHVQQEGAVFAQVHQFVQDLLFPLPDLRRVGDAVGGQPHELVFAAVDLEAAVIGEGRIEQAERMGKVELAQDLDARCPGRHRSCRWPIRRRRRW